MIPGSVGSVVNDVMGSMVVFVICAAIVIPYAVWFFVTAWRGGFDD